MGSQLSVNIFQPDKPPVHIEAKEYGKLWGWFLSCIGYVSTFTEGRETHYITTADLIKSVVNSYLDNNNLPKSELNGPGYDKLNDFFKKEIKANHKNFDDIKISTLYTNFVREANVLLPLGYAYPSQPAKPLYKVR